MIIPLRKDKDFYIWTFVLMSKSITRWHMGCKRPSHRSCANLNDFVFHEKFEGWTFQDSWTPGFLESTVVGGKVVPLTMARLFVLCGENALGSSNSIYMHVRCQEGSSAALLETKLQSTSVGPSCLQVTRLFMESLKQLAIHAQKQTKRLDRAMQAFQPCHKVHEPTKHRFYIVATSCFVGQSAYISLYFSIFLQKSRYFSIFYTYIYMRPWWSHHGRFCSTQLPCRSFGAAWGPERRQASPSGSVTS